MKIVISELRSIIKEALQDIYSRLDGEQAVEYFSDAIEALEMISSDENILFGSKFYLKNNKLFRRSWNPSEPMLKWENGRWERAKINHETGDWE